MLEIHISMNSSNLGEPASQEPGGSLRVNGSQFEQHFEEADIVVLEVLDLF
jgi:hypothetical protein